MQQWYKKKDIKKIDCIEYKEQQPRSPKLERNKMKCITIHKKKRYQKTCWSITKVSAGLHTTTIKQDRSE